MPKITGRSLMEHRDNTRQALFRSLSELMAEKGFESVSISDLAKHSGIRRTTIYNHFTDKEDILIGFVESEMSAYLESTEEMLEGAHTSIDRLRIYIRSQLLAERTCLMAPGPPLRDVLSPDAGMKLAQHIKQTSTLLKSILTEAIDSGAIPEQDVPTSVQLINGTVTGRRIPEKDPERTEFFHATERFIIRALGGEVPEDMTDLGPIPPCH
ncbi:TetR/AcrR family transcriptional regulator [Flaviflexus massiliensis]|uniref:TetR/AcrR family transcriptional regulator n=1 Tax=Flaviflexus massiliensis TaxID=1522309 RepID=UPI0006D587DD|nr:TetR/AcrR family transcriptional regulator [Flaviflexus massiliensis]